MIRRYQHRRDRFRINLIQEAGYGVVQRQSKIAEIRQFHFFAYCSNSIAH